MGREMQTVKPRARWLVGGDPAKCQMWEVSHPQSYVKFWSDRPHDAAVDMLTNFVVPEQVEQLQRR